MQKELKKNTKTSKFNFNTSWEELLESKEFLKFFLSDILEDYIIKQRWYAGK